jgi:hypothetical protein
VGRVTRALQVIRQPGVHLADAVLQKSQVPIVVKQPGFHPGDLSGEPLAVGEGTNLSSHLGDTWAWTGTTWTQLSPAASPSPRDSDSLA